MQKDTTILELIDRLYTTLGHDAFMVKDYWDADRYAVGLVNRQDTRLVYISTWQCDAGVYYVALEHTLQGAEITYVPSGDLNNVSYEQLEQIIRYHLEY